MNSYVPVIVVKGGKARCVNPPLHLSPKEALDNAVLELERSGEDVESLFSGDKVITVSGGRSSVSGAVSEDVLVGGDNYELLRNCAMDRLGVAMPTLLRIRDKQGKLVPFRCTEAHKKFKDTRRRFAYVVKGRQMYVTSFVVADYYLDCVLGEGIRSNFVNINSSTTAEVFERVRGFNHNFPVRDLLPSLDKDKSDRFLWANGSSFSCMTAKNDDSEENAKTLGRSLTYQRNLVTEAGYLKHYRAFMDGMTDSLPIDGILTVESTANGAQGGFYEDVMEIYEYGKEVHPNVWWLGEKSLHFMEWWNHYEYTMQQDIFSVNEIRDRMTSKYWDILKESDALHEEQMRKGGFQGISGALNWRHWWLVNKKGFFRDPEGSLAVMETEFPSTVKSAFRTSGSSFFSTLAIDNKRERARVFCKERELPLWGRMGGDEGFSTPVAGNDIAFYKGPYNIASEKWVNRYVIGGDPSGGDKGGDPAVIFVKDRLMNQYVAYAGGAFGPVKFADMLVDLAKWYDNALVSFELNNHGAAVQLRVWDRGYKNVYIGRPGYDDYRGYGFFTLKNTRRDGLALLQTRFNNTEDGLMIFCDEFYKEASGFKMPVGSAIPEGVGVHDDCIIAAMVTEVACASLPPCKKVEHEVASFRRGVGMGNLV